MRCGTKNKTGMPCGAQAVKNSKYCYMHDPELSVERDAARKRGGQRLRARHGGDARLLSSHVRRIEEVMNVLDYVLAETVPLENSVQRGRLLVAICNVFLEAIKLGEFEARILALESIIRDFHPQGI